MSTLPFRTLALFSIYSNVLGKHSSTKTEDQEVGAEVETKSDAELELEKVLFFFSNDENSKKRERKSRLMGTVMGMADFARMLSAGDAPNVRSVYSQKQRMLWIEPEKGYFIHATIELPQPKKNSKQSSGDSQEDKASMLYLEDEPILEALSSAYSSYRLKYGTFKGYLEREGIQRLLERLQVFWSNWLEKWSLQTVIRNGLESLVGGFRSFPLASTSKLQMDPLLSQFKASNPSTIPIILNGREILHLPSIQQVTRSNGSLQLLSTDSISLVTTKHSLPLTADDLTSLVDQILATLPPPTTSIPLKKKPSRMENFRSPSPANSSSSEKSNTNKSESRWSTYTLGMGSYLSTAPSVNSIRTMANLPSLAITSAMNITIPDLSSMMSSSINGMRREVSKVDLADVEPSDIVEEEVTAEVSGQVEEQLPDTMEDYVLESSITVKDLDSLSLAEAINAETFDLMPSTSTSTEIKDISSLVEVLHYYCGEGDLADTPMEVRVYKRGILTLALASTLVEDAFILDSKASRLLEGIESIISDAPPPLSTSFNPPHRTLIKTGEFKSSNNWPTRDDVWSGNNSGAQEVEGTLFDCYNGLKSEPKIVETFIRLDSKHWIFASRSSEASLSERKDVYAVLPSKIGKEGSFVDASEEIRKLLDSK